MNSMTVCSEFTIHHEFLIDGYTILSVILKLIWQRYDWINNLFSNKSQNKVQNKTIGSVRYQAYKLTLIHVFYFIY